VYSSTHSEVTEIQEPGFINWNQLVPGGMPWYAPSLVLCLVLFSKSPRKSLGENEFRNPGS
jgi:hypothetical protein